jgi:beta-1,4-mannosyl-glycoprotein beta-1,4-N-acetylglucosaminyltransferase
MIYDCFTLNNELDLLEVRLNTLNEVVDKFVIVESDMTFSGHPKTPYYSISQHRFSQWRDKIIHVLVKDMPQETANRWDREFYQRNAISRGLVGVHPLDLIIVSDVDEIPKPEAIRWARVLDAPTAISMKTYYYNLESVSDQFLIGPCCMRPHHNLSPQQLRDRRWEWERYNEGAWHFSFFPVLDWSPVESVQMKIRSFAHGEFDNETYLDAKRLEKVIAGTVDPFERSEFPMHREPVNPSLPPYILSNLEKYNKWLPAPLPRS